MVRAFGYSSSQFPLLGGADGVVSCGGLHRAGRLFLRLQLETFPSFSASVSHFFMESGHSQVLQ